MDEIKKEQEEHTEELPMVDEVVWHREDEEDSLDKPIEKEVRMTPITADEPIEETQPTKKDNKEKIIQKEKQTPKKSNKKIWMIICSVVVVITLICCGIYFLNNYQKEQAAKQAAYQKVYEQLKVTFKEDEKDSNGNEVNYTIYEYGEQTRNPLDIVDTHYGDVTCVPETIDTSKVGTVKLTYTASMQDSYGETVTRDFTLDVTVHDTQSPTIELNDSSITITEGDAFDAGSNIKSVSDVIDGNLEYVEYEPEKADTKAPFYENGWYTYTSDVDTEVPGKYTVRIKATDVNGNSTDLAYQVTVKKKDPSSFMTISTTTYTKVLEQLSSEDSNSGEVGKWEDLNGYLGTVLYQSEQYTSQDEMMKDGKEYLSNHFDELTKNKATKQIPVLGSITVEAKEAAVYYMEALDDDGNIMYYFYAIV